LLVDFSARLAIGLAALATEPVSIHDDAFPIPASCLDQALSGQNDNQARRYGALMRALRAAPVAQAKPQTVIARWDWRKGQPVAGPSVQVQAANAAGRRQLSGQAGKRP
jgi:hypothetical protein